MENYYAIIDLGTNTFHLLIAKIIAKDQFVIVSRKQIPVKLGEDGINEDKIGPLAFDRGLQALEKFRKLCLQYPISQTRLIATSALRNAGNKEEFIARAKKIFAEEITIIDGDREAELIYFGTRWAVGMWEYPSLIVDIGGGSVEFIIADKYHILWKKSLEIGASRLLQLFPHGFPPSAEEKDQVKDYLRSRLKEVIDEANKFSINSLIGASGSFETYASLELNYFLDIKTTQLPLMHPIQKGNLKWLIGKILNSRKEELENLEGMASFRVDMIVVSSLLTQVILEDIAIEKIYYSDYALKQGVLWEIMKKTVLPGMN